MHAVVSPVGRDATTTGSWCIHYLWYTEDNTRKELDADRAERKRK